MTTTTTLANEAIDTRTASKRKRNQISYAVDDYFDPKDFAEDDMKDEMLDGEVLSDIDDDGAYGRASKRKSAKKNKRRRLTMSKPKAVKPPQPFRFLDLPQELRDMIYREALAQEHGVGIVCKFTQNRRTARRGDVHDTENFYQRRWHRLNGLKDSQDEPKPQDKTFVTNLLATCKQIRQEAEIYLYRQQKFSFQDSAALFMFLSSIGARNCDLLQHITLMDWSWGRTSKGQHFSALTELRHCLNLKSISFRSRVYTGWRSAGAVVGLARQFYRDASIFLIAYGAKHGSKDAAISLFSCRELEENDGKVDSKKVEEFQREMRKLLGVPPVKVEKAETKDE